MKKIFNILFLCASAAALAGCEDFLDREPTNNMAAGKVWTSDDYATRAVNGIYKIANNEYALQGYGVRFSSWGPDGFNYFYSSSMETGIATTSEKYFINFYAGWYEMIRAANEVITNLDNNGNITETLRDRLIAEAKYFRGMGHFLLWHFFGDVVIRDKYLPVEDTHLKQSPAAQVLAFARQDFKDASEVLPVSYDANDWGRITKGAAIAMLGKTYLYNEEWEDAAKEFAKLMTAPFTYDLHPVYAELFDWKTEVNDEVIHSLQFVGQTGYGCGYDGWYGSRSNNSYGGAECVASHITLSNYTYKDGSAIDFSTRPKRSAYSDETAYGIDLMTWYENLRAEELDERLEANLILPTALFVGEKNNLYKLYWPYKAYSSRTEEPLALRLEFATYATLPWRKLVNVGTENSSGSPNDFPLIRFADVLLMFAEAVNEDAGPGSDVYDAVNRVRNRAGLEDLPDGLSKAEMQKAIRQERLREFPGEGHLFLDVRRWKTAHTTDPLFGLNHDVLDFRGEKLFRRVFPEKYYQWPIPFAAMQINKELVQNSKWTE